jgi:hypothetical protein
MDEKNNTKIVEVFKGIFINMTDMDSFIDSLGWHRIEGHCCMACEKVSGGVTRTSYGHSDKGRIEFFKHFAETHDGFQAYRKWLLTK